MYEKVIISALNNGLNLKKMQQYDLNKLQAAIARGRHVLVQWRRENLYRICGRFVIVLIYCCCFDVIVFKIQAPWSSDHKMGVAYGTRTWALSWPEAARWVIFFSSSEYNSENLASYWTLFKFWNLQEWNIINPVRTKLHICKNYAWNQA